ncbi:hypothetical protein IHE45_07G077900 [Dioscorea alata]|uniref:Uncharacterized protein n=1 Tax=Dioscorea alata TaxID=55571 RepID=A0ACB7VSR5_DIOAL|nr:hypothetical protein IHE45_07G077900 [Dioscorea alata]
MRARPKFFFGKDDVQHLVSLCARISYSKIVCLIMAMTEHDQNWAC